MFQYNFRVDSVVAPAGVESHDTDTEIPLDSIVEFHSPAITSAGVTVHTSQSFH